MNIPILHRAYEHGSWKVHTRLEKWDDIDLVDRRGLGNLQRDQLIQELPPTEVIEEEGNLLLTAGIGRMLDLLIGAGGQAMNNTHCRIGTGNGSTVVTAADTDLSAAAGSANRWFNMADATYPSRATNVLSVVSTFATGDGNYAWTEWGIDFGTANGNTVTAPLLNRKVPASSLGTKGSGAPWAFSVTITIS